MKYNLRNIYCFNNAIRHFIYIDNLKFPDFQDYNINNISWTKPIDVKIKKDYDSNSCRLLKLPNIMNFKFCFEQYKNLERFKNLKQFSSNSRMAVNYKNGTFMENSYSINLNKDLQILCTYDCLLKMDIKSFYDKIYTHKITELIGVQDNYYASMNSGQTNGLILGNYISLYFAELILKDISETLLNIFCEKKINVKFSYFSDDFYFFCNRNDVEYVRKVFNDVLLSRGFSESEKKYLNINYETYNNDNIIERYWKKNSK